MLFTSTEQDNTREKAKEQKICKSKILWLSISHLSKYKPILYIKRPFFGILSFQKNACRNVLNVVQSPIFITL